jgi:hypothetical protein
MESNFWSFPFHLDGHNRTTTTIADEHIRDMIYQVLFTTPGERVNRPDFGCGLRSLVFMPNSDALAAATQVLVKASLQRWLENEIQVEKVSVSTEEEKLMVTLVYIRRATGERRVEQFNAPA